MRNPDLRPDADRFDADRSDATRFGASASGAPDSGADDTPRLPDGLAARLRGLPEPDPGPGYFDGLPSKVRARLTVGTVSRPAGRPVGGSDRPARARAPRRAAPAWRVAALSAAVVLALVAVAVQVLQPTPGVSAGPGTVAQAPGRPGEMRPGEMRPGQTSRPGEALASEGTGSDTLARQDSLRRSGAPAAVPALAEPTPARSRRRAAPASPLRAPSMSNPVRSQRLATTAPPPGRSASPGVRPAAPSADETGALLASVNLAGMDAEGEQVLRRAQIVVLALQNAARPDDVAILAPLATDLAADLARWRTRPDLAPGVRALADALDPFVVGLAALDPGDVDTARALHERARATDLAFHVDRVLLATERTPVVAY